MINFDPTKPLPKGEYEWNDPALKYIPPSGIGANPHIYLNNLLMLVLESNCPPSPRGLYNPVEIAREWIPWLKAHVAFNELAHIEETVDTNGEPCFFLWRKQDWNESASAITAKQEEYKKASDEWWCMRCRAYRAVTHLHDYCNVGWARAQELVKDWARLYYSMDSSFPQELIDSQESLLRHVHWFDPISTDELTEFKHNWKPKSGHTYLTPFDVLQDED